MSDAAVPELPFASVKFRKSYEMGPVDALLKRVDRAIANNALIELQTLHSSLLTMALPTTKWREGYVMSEVDMRLDEEHQRVSRALGIPQAEPMSLADFPLAEVFRKDLKD